MRIKERLEEKRRQGSEWIGAVGTDTVKKNHQNKLISKSKHVHGYSTVSLDAFTLDSAVTEDLTLCSSSCTTTGGDTFTGCFLTKDETVSSAPFGTSFDEFSCSTCSYKCSFEQYEHPNQQMHQLHYHSGTSTIQSAERCSVSACEDCGCVSASSSFKQEEMEIVFDADLYRNMKSNRMLFSTPFLREQHMKVLRSGESLYDQAACSVQSHDFDQDGEFSYSGFFLEEIQGLPRKQYDSIRSKPNMSGSQRQPDSVSREKRSAVTLYEQAPDDCHGGEFAYSGFFLDEVPTMQVRHHKSIRSKSEIIASQRQPDLFLRKMKSDVPVAKTSKEASMLGSVDTYSDEETVFTAGCPALNEQLKQFNFTDFDGEEAADDCSYSAFFLEEIVPLTPKHTIELLSGTHEYDGNSVVVPSFEENISCSRFQLSKKLNLKQEMRNGHEDGPRITHVALTKCKDCSKPTMNPNPSSRLSTENNLGDDCLMRQTNSKSSPETDRVIFATVVPVFDDGYDDDKESNISDTFLTSFCGAACKVYIGEVHETLLDCGQTHHSQNIAPEEQNILHSGDRSVKQTLAAFDALYASWPAIRHSSRSPSASNEQVKDEELCWENFDKIGVNLSQSIKETTNTCLQVAIETTMTSSIPNKTAIPNMTINMSDRSREIIYVTKLAISKDDYDPGSLMESCMHLQRPEPLQLQLQFKFR